MVRFILVVLVALLMPIAGCGNLNKVPRYRLDADGQPVAFKRFAAYDERDFINRFRAEAYFPRKDQVEGPLSDEQRGVLERHGMPDFIRYRFKASTNELVDQWAWWDRNVTVQFVQRELVWEGPLTDYDRTLIERGYPSRAKAMLFQPGQRRDIFEYEGIFKANSLIVTFTEEKLASTATH